MSRYQKLATSFSDAHLCDVAKLYTKQRHFYQILTKIILVILWFLLLFLLSDVSFENGFYMSAGPLKTTVLIILIFVEMCIYVIILVIIEMFAIKKIRFLLDDECDALGYTMILDNLLYYKLIGEKLGAFNLLPALKASDNIERMKIYIVQKNSYYKLSNNLLVYQFTVLSDQEKEISFMEFYEKDKIIIKNALLREKSSHKKQDIKNILLDLECMKAMYEKEWEKVITISEKLSTSTNLNAIIMKLRLGKCYLNLKDETKAREYFEEVIKLGNTTCYVEKAKQCLENITKI